MTSYTNTKWVLLPPSSGVDNNWHITDDGDTCVLHAYGFHHAVDDYSKALAKRAHACLTVCVGIPTARLEAGSAGILTYSMELKAHCDALLAALQGMIDIANDSQGVAGYHLNGEVADWGEFEEWQAACDAIAKIKGGAVNHFPGAAKMVAHEGWQLVPVEPTSAMLISSGSTAPRYRAMLAAAPKHEGGAS